MENKLRNFEKEIELLKIEKNALSTENKSAHNNYKIMEREFKKAVKERDAIKYEYMNLEMLK